MIGPVLPARQLRYEHASLVLTSDLSFSGWAGVSGDQTRVSGLTALAHRHDSESPTSRRSPPQQSHARPEPQNGPPPAPGSRYFSRSSIWRRRAARAARRRIDARPLAVACSAVRPPRCQRELPLSLFLHRSSSPELPGVAPPVAIMPLPTPKKIPALTQRENLNLAPRSGRWGSRRAVHRGAGAVLEPVEAFVFVAVLPSVEHRAADAVVATGRGHAAADLNTAPRRSWRCWTRRATSANASRVLDLCAPTASPPRCSPVGAENSPNRGRLEVVSSTRRDGAETGDTVGVGVHYYRGADGDQRRGGSSGG